MTKSEIEKLVRYEVRNAPFLSGMHDINMGNIDSYLTTPYEMNFLEPISNKIERHWVVLDENHQNKEGGYLVFYSEHDSSFGLGTKTNVTKIPNLGTFVGVYGSLSDAIKSM